MMQARQQIYGLTRMLQLAQRQSQAAAALGTACPAWMQQQAAALHATRDRWAAGGGITGWLSSKLPSMLGGDRVDDLDIETFATTIKRARQLGGLTGFVHGTTAISDGAAQGTLRMFEHIIGAMTAEEKNDLSLFDRAARQRVAAEVGATTSQVDDCIARYLWTRSLTQKVAQLKREGKEMPRSVDEVERLMGTWRQYKTESAAAADGSGSGGSGSGIMVPLGHQGHKGQPCPLAGMEVGKNTKCPATKKAFKACCGKKLQLGG